MNVTGVHVTDGDATADAVVADIACQKVIIRPKGTDTTGGYTVFAPSAASTGILREENEEYVFDAGAGNLYQANRVVGFTKTVSAGPFNFTKKHE
jgi:hypothetical protein